MRGLPTFLALALAALACLPLAARAQSKTAAAEALFEDGRRAMDASAFDIACAKFRESLRLDPAPGTQLNLADCEEKRGHIATAWALFRDVISKLPADDFRVPVAEDRHRQLEPRLPKLRLRASTFARDDLRVAIGELELGPASFDSDIPLDPGRHEVVITNGGAQETLDVTLLEGEVTELEVPTRPTETISSANDAPSGEARAPAHLEPGGDPDRTWAYAVGGVGVAGLVVGAVFGLMALDEKATGDRGCDDTTRTCTPEASAANEDAQTFSVVSTVGWAVGGVAIAGSAVLYFTASPAEDAGFLAGYRGTW